jgi:hypothetical protein
MATATIKMNPDGDIPVAYGTAIPVFEPMPPPARPSLQESQQVLGRSSRVVLSREASEKISQAAIDKLKKQGYTHGLAVSLIQMKRHFPLRIFLVDNSGSMSTQDGHRLVETSKAQDVRVVLCTRWGEMQETVSYHVQMAALIEAPTTFRLLNDPGQINGPQQFGVADKGHSRISQDVDVAINTIKNSTPGGVTPLVQHLREIRENVLELQPSLRRDGTRVVITIAT